MKAIGLIPANGAPRLCPCGAWIIPAAPAASGRRRVFVDAQLSIIGTLVLWFEVDGVSGEPIDPPLQRVSEAPSDYRGPRWANHLLTCAQATPFRRREAAKVRLPSMFPEATS